MGELDEQRWSVMSERGSEASGLTYAEAARLLQQLRADDGHGLCVVTDAAARHLPRVASAPASDNDQTPLPSAATKPPTAKASRRKK